MDSPDNKTEMMVENKDSNNNEQEKKDIIIDLDKIPGNKPKKDNHHNEPKKIKDYSVQINENLQKVFNVSDAKYEEECKCKDSPYIEVAFSDHRKALFHNVKKLKFQMFEYVIVQLESGLELGTVISCGKEAHENFKLIYHGEKPEFKVIRRALKDDINKLQKNQLDEVKALNKAKELVEKHKLDMKVTAAEWQFDRHRLTVFFTAPSRVDFRELVKDLAKTFHTRIELRQISTREEARRIGGMGPCGLNICCTSFASDYCHVTVDHARQQNMPNNISKLSGYCGRLKCCLLYEHDIYVEILRKYPPINSTIETNEGKAILNKIDVFKEIATLYIPSLGVYKSITGEELIEYQKDGKVTPPAEDENHNGYDEKEVKELEADY